MTRYVNFHVPGVPIAQPRPRVTTIGGMARAYVPAKHPVHAYRASIAAAWLELSETPFEGPILMEVVFWFPRTKAMTWKTKPMFTTPKTSKPDIDNLFKAVADGLEGHAYKNDSQVTGIKVEKLYVGLTNPRTDISIKEVK